jgi:hypothetical protein
MRKLASIAGAAFLALTALASPASAQSMSAGGSCGMSAGDYGLSDINSHSVNPAGGHGVPNLFYTVNYAGVPAPTTVGVIVRYNGELESQITVGSVTAPNAGGSFDGAIRANIDPANQGFANSIDNSFRGRSDNGPVTFSGNESGNKNYAGYLRGGTGNSGTQGGLTPGEYVFYVYTGSVGDVYNVKDGTVARNAFIADEKGFLGWFSCGISTDQGSGPG